MLGLWCQQTSNQSSAISSWPDFVISCLNRPYLYLRPYPHAGKLKVAIESRKQEASLPRPPLPSAASFSCYIQLNSALSYIGMQVSKDYSGAYKKQHSTKQNLTPYLYDNPN